MLVAVAAVVSFGIAKRSNSKKKRSGNKPKEHQLVIDHRDLLSAIVPEQASLVEVFAEFCSWVRKSIPPNTVPAFSASVFLTRKVCPAEHLAIAHQDWLTAIGLTTGEIRKSVDETQIFTQLARVSNNLLVAVSNIQNLVRDITDELPTIQRIRFAVSWMRVPCTKLLDDLERHRSIWATMSSKVKDLHSAITLYYEKVLERTEITEMAAEDSAITTTTSLSSFTATSSEDSDAKNEEISNKSIPTERPESVEATTKKLTRAEIEDTDDEDEEISNNSIPTERPATFEATTKKLTWAEIEDTDDEDEEISKKSMPTERPESVEATTKKLTWAEIEDTDDEDEEISNESMRTARPETVEDTTQRICLADIVFIFTHLEWVSDNLLDMVNDVQMLVENIVPDLPTIRHIMSKVDVLKDFSSKFLHDIERHRSICVTMSGKVEVLDSAITDYYEKVLERTEITEMAAEDRAITPTTSLSSFEKNEEVTNESIPTERPETVEATMQEFTWAEMKDTDDEDEEIPNKNVPTARPQTVKATNEIFVQETTTTTTMEPIADWKVVNNRRTRRNERKYYK